MNPITDELRAKLAAAGVHDIDCRDGRGVDPCEDGSQNHDWRRADLGCWECGDHQGFMCNTCMLSVDAVFDAEAYKVIDAAQSAV